MKKTTLSIGLNDKDTKYQIIDGEKARHTIASLLVYNGVDGATISDGIGIYKHENGALIVENSIIVTMFEVDENAVKNACNAIKTALNQESILIENTISDAVFF